MSSDFGGFRTVKAGKEHTNGCVHCHGTICKGESHEHYVGRWQGEFQSWRVHSDCAEACEHCQQAIDDDGALCPNGHRRGLSCEEIGPECPPWKPAPDDEGRP